ncbi:MAG: 16S rRNA (guanine(966)-N(2))-methyltransferase RsmD [Acidobacteria bacterium]|nr:16S rRNA (guanine(966)-N(2))-methyltransferase RsmD [Acidobacteriota bacterium]
MRIIAGEFRGRRLKTLPGRAVRPTSDKLRETLFNIIRAEVPDSVFVDCYAGSGAVGLEALSRGAREVFLIEQDAAAARIIEQNIFALGASLGIGQTAHIIRAGVKVGLRRLAAKGVRASICFLDPPYASLPEALSNLSWLSESALMLREGLLILEHSRRDSTPDQVGPWRRTRVLSGGSSSLSFYLLPHIDHG